jgi:hypothetical protein
MPNACSGHAILLIRRVVDECPSTGSGGVLPFGASLLRCGSRHRGHASTSSNRASLSRRRLLEGDERAGSAAAAPRADLWGLSVLGRFNSLIVDLVSLIV